jgi:hypothetical protein
LISGTDLRSQSLAAIQTLPHERAPFRPCGLWTPPGYGQPRERDYPIRQYAVVHGTHRPCDREELFGFWGGDGSGTPPEPHAAAKVARHGDAIEAIAMAVCRGDHAKAVSRRSLTWTATMIDKRKAVLWLSRSRTRATNERRIE